MSGITFHTEGKGETLHIDDSGTLPPGTKSPGYKLDGPRKMTDNVNGPAHYTSGTIECIVAIQAALGAEFKGFLRGNVIKYLWRYQDKGGVEDLRKARWYLERLIKEETDV